MIEDAQTIEQAQLGPTSEGSVILDLAPDRGALILYTPPALAGAEIEVSPQGSDVRTHVAVRERRTGPSSSFAAFYPSLPAGEYTIWGGPDGSASERVTIPGGRVTTVDWRDR